MGTTVSGTVPQNATHPTPPQAVATTPPPLARVARVRVRDFRSIEDAELDLGEVTVLMGENNVGKSAFLEALDVAIGSRKAATSDLRVSTSSVAASFAIDIELTPWAGKRFDQGVTDVFGVTLRTEPSSGRQRYFIRTLGEQDATQRSVTVRRGFVDDWQTAVTPHFLDPVTSEQRSAIWFTLLDAQRDLVADLRLRTSPWGKMLRRLQLNASTRQALEAQLATLSASVTQALPDAAKLAAAMSRLQSVLSGQVSQARLAMLPKRLEELWRTTDLLVQASGHAELSIGQQGMGARSLSSILAFRAWLAAEAEVSIEPPLAVLTAFEEPETHLHPQAQKSVFREITQINGQCLVSTHSPQLASAADISTFRVVRRTPSVSVRSTREIDSDPGMTADGLAKVRRFCLSRNGDMLFARLVILGEGDTEAGVLPELARAWWGGSPEERGVAIVPMDGAGNARTFAGFLERLGIPWIVLLDGDPAGLNEHSAMSKVPLLAPLVGTRALVVSHAGQNVDLEELLAHVGGPAALRAIAAGNPSAAARLGAHPTPASMADELRERKATLSRRLGEELAKDWGTRAAFPPLLNQLFTLADTLL